MDITDKNAGAGDRKTEQAIRQMLERLEAGENPEAVKRQFGDLLDGISPEEIARVERELVGEGLPRESLHKLCDVHMALLKDQLGGREPAAPEGHPLHTLMEEHRLMLLFAEKLSKAADSIGDAKSEQEASAAIEQVSHLLEHLRESEKHYLREENVLFPYLDKHGIKEPPAVMWMEHDRIRELKKALYALHDDRGKVPLRTFAARLKESAVVLGETLSSHFFKENNVLFPMAMKALSAKEWPEVSREFGEVGYCCFTPDSAARAGEGGEAAAGTAPGGGEGRIDLGMGSLTPKEIGALLNSLPVDVTFVDSDDRVRYFSQTRDRIFVRTKAVIGRQVQMCHPQKSVHLVNTILEDFRHGRRDSAEFWLILGGKFIYIRYFPVRNPEGEYLGCLEVTQDLTRIRTLEGEKRLLDG